MTNITDEELELINSLFRGPYSNYKPVNEYDNELFIHNVKKFPDTAIKKYALQNVPQIQNQDFIEDCQQNSRFKAFAARNKKKQNEEQILLNQVFDPDYLQFKPVDENEINSFFKDIEDQGEQGLGAWCKDNIPASLISDFIKKCKQMKKLAKILKDSSLTQDEKNLKKEVEVFLSYNAPDVQSEETDYLIDYLKRLQHSGVAKWADKYVPLIKKEQFLQMAYQDLAQHLKNYQLQIEDQDIDNLSKVIQVLNESISKDFNEITQEEIFDLYNILLGGIWDDIEQWSLASINKNFHSIYAFFLASHVNLKNFILNIITRLENINKKIEESVAGSCFDSETLLEYRPIMFENEGKQQFRYKTFLENIRKFISEKCKNQKDLDDQGEDMAIQWAERNLPGKVVEEFIYCMKSSQEVKAYQLRILNIKNLNQILKRMQLKCYNQIFENYTTKNNWSTKEGPPGHCDDFWTKMQSHNRKFRISCKNDKTTFRIEGLVQPKQILNVDFQTHTNKMPLVFRLIDHLILEIPWNSKIQGDQQTKILNSWMNLATNVSKLQISFVSNKNLSQANFKEILVNLEKFLRLEYLRIDFRHTILSDVFRDSLKKQIFKLFPKTKIIFDGFLLDQDYIDQMI